MAISVPIAYTDRFKFSPFPLRDFPPSSVLNLERWIKPYSGKTAKVVHGECSRVDQQKKWMTKQGGYRCIFLLIMCLLWPISVIASDPSYEFDIPEADASAGLKRFAKETRTPLLFLSEDLQNRRTNRVYGSYTFDEALELLLEETGLEATVNQSGVLTVSVAEKDHQVGGDEMDRSAGFFRKLAVILISGFTAAGQLSPLQAQEGALRLEEVIVTAQRREQSLQEVPISIGVYSGEQIALQGYRNLDDLSRYSPSVSIRNGVTDQEVTIRGFGTAGNSLTLASATPLFVDGIHFSRSSMIKNAFMDTERVEVLKGPQPLHFGMNATAGAFNIQSRRPTAEWQGDIAAEYGNDGNREVSGGVGGPLTGTLGVRLAGIYEVSDGPVKNIYDTSKNIAGYDNLGGRISLEWTPNDRLNVYSKFEISRQKNGGILFTGCLTEGALSGYSAFGIDDDGPLSGVDESLVGLFGPGEAVLAPRPKGIGSESIGGLPPGALALEAGQDCFNGNYGFPAGEEPNLAPPANTSGESTRSATDGVVDFRAVAREFMSADGPGGAGVDGIDMNGELGKDDVDSWNAVLDINYRLDNGININSQTGFLDFIHKMARDNSIDPFLSNEAVRLEDISQFSQQLRITSPDEGYDLDVSIPGAVNLEFMVGGMWQVQTLEALTSTTRDNVRRNIWVNKAWEDAEWFAGFWSLTFNLWDRQLALEVGGRYTDVSKDVFLRGSAGELLWDEAPCDADPANNPTLDDDPATCPIDPDFKRVNPGLTSFTSFDPSLPGQTITDFENIGTVRVDSPRILLDADVDNLWAPAKFRGTTNVPLNWRSPAGATPVGFTAPVFSVQGGPFGPCASCVSDVRQRADNYDSQFVLRYTPNALNGTHTFYGKYAEAFKGPVTDTGLSGLPGDLSELVFNPEYTKSWEIGVRGNLFDNRVRYDVTGFMSDFRDLQTSAAAPSFDPTRTRFIGDVGGEQSNVSLNAGKQEVNGIEFSIQAAMTQNLTLNLAGALMDGKMADFDGGGCNGDELIAAAIDATTPGSAGGTLEDRSADELDFANEILDTIGPTRVANLPARADLPSEFFRNGGCRLEDTAAFADGTSSIGEAETIDRSGSEAPYTPDWKFVVGADYTLPVMDEFEVFLNAQGFISDGFLPNPENFRWEDAYRRHGDVSLSAGFGSRDGTWRLVGFARNLLEATKSYNPEYELEQRGMMYSEVPRTSFTSYGLRFEFNYR